MKAKNAKLGADLVAALKVLPKARRALSDKPHGYHDAIWLEMQAAEMQDGESQGSTHWFDVPPRIGRKILDAAEKIIRAELSRIGVDP
jgi:hypothetical protein